eukprot:TRINITY_DN8208_c0_g2_i1.p1 TRINITY_DN8208_c0_g2~~TRINITY_DN8208_c0_g2_i1.p1  ORF type:complete len:1026 (+),score=124.44 TRINITY_DN8208_c0_g2_i1:87-3164(+)
MATDGHVSIARLRGSGDNRIDDNFGESQVTNVRRKLPEALIPFAERLFRWFPEVLVSLGHPLLHELFELPPMAGAEMTFEECSEYKLVHLRLRRRTRSRQAQKRAAPNRSGVERAANQHVLEETSGTQPGCESPFSASRALVGVRGEANRSVQQNDANVSASSVATTRVPAAKIGPHFAPLEQSSPVSTEAMQGRRSPSAQSSQREPPSRGGDQENILLSPFTPESPFCHLASEPAQNGDGQGAASASKTDVCGLGDSSTKTVVDQTSCVTSIASLLPTEQVLVKSEASSYLSDSLENNAKPESAYYHDHELFGEIVPTAAGTSRGLSSRGERPRPRSLSQADPGSPKFASPGTHNPWASFGEVRRMRRPSDAASKTDSDHGRDSVAGSSGEGAFGVSLPGTFPRPTLSRGETSQAPANNGVTDAPMTKQQLCSPPGAVATPRTASSALSSAQPSPMVQSLEPSSPRLQARVTSDSPGGSPLSDVAQTVFPQPSAQAIPSGVVAQTTTSPSSPASTPAEDREGGGGEEEASCPTCLRQCVPKVELDDSNERADVSNAAQRRLSASSTESSGCGGKGEKMAASKPPLAPSQGSDVEGGTVAVGSAVGGEARSAGVKTPPLKDRRGKPNIAPFLDPNRFSSFSRDVTSPPAVLPPMATGGKASHRHLPGAFPTRRTLIVFDWDDTLCPTSWIRRLLKEHIADITDWKKGDQEWRDEEPDWFWQPLPDDPRVRDSILRLQRAVIDVITVAQSLGLVLIVTNSMNGWVGKTIKKWLPKLAPTFFGHGTLCPPIQVLYGQQEYQRPRADSSASQLGWVDDLGELMWWKKVAMSTALERIDNFYRVAPVPQSPSSLVVASRSSSSSSSSSSNGNPMDAKVGGADSGETLENVPWQADYNTKNLVNLISIGDNDAEIQSATLAALLNRAELRSGCETINHRRRPLSAPPCSRMTGRPWIKTLKLYESPSVDQIVEQLDVLTKSLPQLVAAREHLQLDPMDLPVLLPTGMDEEKLAEHAIELRLQQLLRTQSI